MSIAGCDWDGNAARVQRCVRRRTAVCGAAGVLGESMPPKTESIRQRPAQRRDTGGSQVTCSVSSTPAAVTATR
jgi:hypothetical protein